MLDAYDQCGWLPSWSFPSEAGSMIGNHSNSLLADAWAKGIRTFDANKASPAYLHEATNKRPWGSANTVTVGKRIFNWVMFFIQNTEKLLQKR